VGSSCEWIGGSIDLKDQERDILRKTILELVKKGHVHYTDIEKKACATCLSFATTNTVRKQFYHYLLLNGYVERISRGVYKITSKGEKLLEILN
jgi:predicted transcriptional regulator